MQGDSITYLNLVSEHIAALLKKELEQWLPPPPPQEFAPALVDDPTLTDSQAGRE